MVNETENVNSIEIIRKMIAAGADDAAILRNLHDLGITDETANQMLKASRTKETGSVRTVLSKPEIVIETYQLKSEGMSVEVNIIQSPHGFVLEYALNLPEYGSGTRALLNNLKNSIISDASIRTEKMLDPKFIADLKEKFGSRAQQILDHELPRAENETKNMLVHVLLQEMLGLGKIEFLFADSNLEEIVINSAAEPIWVYSKKYGWLKTNIFLGSEEEIQNFSSIIARRVGKQITTLNPILDAHLITGDRANATLFPISSRGNTITIRRFRRDPWTVTDFINSKTVNAEIMALVWLAMQYEMNIIVSGGTASGKCVRGDTRILIGNGEKTIEQIVESAFQKSVPTQTADGFWSAASDIELFSFNPATTAIERTLATRVWKRKAPDKMFKITTQSGKQLEVTPEHPFFVMQGEICKKRADEVGIGDFVPAVRKLKIFKTPKKHERIATLEKTLDAATSTQTQRQIAWLKQLTTESAVWDKIIKIETVKPDYEWVYDLTVEPNHTFIGNNLVAHNTSLMNVMLPFIQPNHRIITIEDTRELQLPEFLHWVPLTTREPNAEGKGGVSMLDLLVNSLRMRPDRIIVGETRRQAEAEVMFEGMHTGHSVYSTFHANTADETIRRFINAPINISSTMLDAVHLNLVMFRNRRLGVRRMLQIAEFIPEKRGGEEVIHANVLYRWRASSDEIVRNSESIRFADELTLHTGLSGQEIGEDLQNKQKILEWMVKKNIHDVQDVGHAMAEYYLDESTVLDWVAKDQLPEFLQGVRLSKEENQ